MAFKAFSWKQEIIKAEKNLKYLIALYEKKGKMYHANECKAKLKMMKENGIR